MTETPGKLDIAAIVQATLNRADGRPAIEFKGRTMGWDEVRTFVGAIDAALVAAGVQPLHAIGFIARNRGAHAAILAGLIAQRRPISMIYAFQAAEALARDIAALRPAALIASADDWSPEVIRAADGAGTLRLSIPIDPPYEIAVIDTATLRAADHHRLPEPGIEILSSGTTGAPKRIFHRSEVLFRSLTSGWVTVDTDEETPPDLVFWPVSGIGGVLQVARAMISGASLVVLERFTVAEIVDAVQRHKLRSVALTPTMARMIYDADVPKSAFGSLVAFYGGAGPLDLDLQDKLEARYGLPVVWAMGATEFCGSVIAWNLDLKARFGQRKRGSTGRALPGCEVRVQDPETGAVLGAGEIGRLVVRVDLIGPHWIETTDLVAIDEDGFVFHHGRSDGAIIRGGFKIIPERVNEVLRLHPGVAEAAVVGVPDARLGAVPLAAIVRRAGHERLDEATLSAHARLHLPAPQIPVGFRFLEAMPYTASTKIDLKRLKEMLSSS